MVKLIIEPKKAKDGQFEYTVTYHDVKTDNQFTVTTTNDLNEAVQRLKETLESEVATLAAKKRLDPFFSLKIFGAREKYRGKIPAPHRKFTGPKNPGNTGSRIPPDPDTANPNHHSNLNTNLPFSMDKGKHVQAFLHEGGKETEAPWCRTKSGGPVREVFLRLHDHHVRTVWAVFCYPTGIVRVDRHCRENTRGHPVWYSSARCFYHTSVTAGPGAEV